MITRRDDGDYAACDPYYGCDYGYSWWYTPVGYLTKWVIVTVIFIFFSLWFIGGYIHAKARMRKGLPLLWYHRWLVPRYQRPENQGLQNQFSFYQAQQQPGQQQYGYYGPPNGNYGMQGYPAPPPVYSDPPPTYQPPAGASKVNPQQQQPQVNVQDVEAGSSSAPPPPPEDPNLPERPKPSRMNPMARVREMMNSKR